ncbi:MAG: hypothetical protein H7Z41_07740 [Cytophagales bacterium]|nr:hypothetical protein [Armatimonadota bacterium]
MQDRTPNYNLKTARNAPEAQAQDLLIANLVKMAAAQRYFPHLRNTHLPDPPGRSAVVQAVLVIFSALVLLAWIVAANGGTALFSSLGTDRTLAQIYQEADVSSIAAGYARIHGFGDTLAWWHGPWIHADLQAFRPLTSYLHWAQLAAGTRFGFGWVGLQGALLFWAASLMACALVWRLTHSVWCVGGCGLLAPLLRFVNAKQPLLWLTWFPGHPELLCITLLLGGVLTFRWWLDQARSRHLVAAWIYFVSACLVKEYAYLFPAFAVAALAMDPQCPLPRSRRRPVLLQIGLMAGFVLLLWVWRGAVLPHPYNPHLKAYQLHKKTLCFLYNTIYAYVYGEDAWFALLALLLVALGWGIAAVGSRSPAFRAFVCRPLGWLTVLGAFAALGSLVCTFWGQTLLSAAWYAASLENNRLPDFAILLLQFYGLFFTLRHRRELLPLWLLLVVSYLPVISYIGWHYLIQMWFVRLVYWSVFLQVQWRALGSPSPTDLLATLGTASGGTPSETAR